MLAEDYDLGGRRLLGQAMRRVEAAHPRHPDVQQHDVGARAHGQRHRLLAARRFADDFAFALEHDAQVTVESFNP